MSDLDRISVIDIGKTNAKVVLLDCATFEEIAERRIANGVLAGPPYPHYDTEALWSFILDALTEFARQPGFDAISITTHGASAALLAADGELALPVLDYEHDYPQEVSQAYAGLRPPFSETFSPPLSGGLNLGAQLHYQKTVFPADFARVRTILTYPQYWAYRLTGIVANEVTSLGCHTDLWCPREARWSSLMYKLDIGDRMAPIRSAFDKLGYLLPAVSKRLGLSRPVPIYCGIHDSNASLLPHIIGCTPPFAVVSTGTWVVNFAVGGDLDHLDPARDTLANVDAYGRAIPSARFMGGREFETLTGELGALDQQAALEAMPTAIARRIMLSPNTAEGSGPFPGRQAQWFNVDEASPAERWAGACLYLALMTQTCLDLIGDDGPIMVEGPFSQNAVFLTALASLTRRDVLAVHGSSGTCQGAALLTGVTPAPRTNTQFAPGQIDGLVAYAEIWGDLACGAGTLIPPETIPCTQHSPAQPSP